MKKICALMAVLLLLLCSCQNQNAGGYKLPIVCGETGMNSVCGIATYGVNYYNLGVKAGEMAAKILLNGANVSELPVESDTSPSLSINEKVAEEIGFTIPESVKAKVGKDTTVQVARNDAAIVASGADYTVGILQLVQHVALDQANKGFQDMLSAKLGEAGKTVTILDQNASNEQANNITIAESFVSQNVDLIYTIATSSSQAAAAATQTIPILFCAVTDPVDAGLVESLEKPGKNVSGVSDMNPVALQIDLMAELLGKDQIKIGFLYTSAETNSVTQVQLGIKECQAKGFDYVEKGIGDINDIEAAFVALKQAGVDIIYVPTDNLLANGVSNIHSVNIGG